MNSLIEFKNAVLEIAKQVGESYVNVGVEMKQHSASQTEPEVEYRCYINNYGYTDGLTPEEAVEKMYHATGLKKKEVKKDFKIK